MQRMSAADERLSAYETRMKASSIYRVVDGVWKWNGVKSDLAKFYYFEIAGNYSSLLFGLCRLCLPAFNQKYLVAISDNYI